MDMFERQFQDQKMQEAPLAVRMRPANFHDFVGQVHLVGEGRVLRKAIEAGRLQSIVLWGPPGSGKTTLANVIANSIDSYFSPV
ncbi:AAA family ATPase, partial [Chloroflexota bacterium]